MSTVTAITDAGIRDIVMVLPVPESALGNVPELLDKSRKFGWDLSNTNIIRSTHDNLSRGIIETMKKIKASCPFCSLIDPASELCDNNFCYTLTSNKEPAYPLYFDDQHLNDFGVLKVSKLYA